MKKLTIHIEDDSYDNFLNVIKELGYVTIAENEEIPQWQQEEVEKRLTLIKEGKIQTRSWKEAREEIFKP